MNQSIKPTCIATSPPKLTKAELSQLTAALDRLAAVDRKLEEIETIRDAVLKSSRAFALGELTLLQSASLATIPPEAIPLARGALRSGCKSVQRQILGECTELIRAHRQHVVDDLKQRCQILETTERDSAKNIGVEDHDYRPSGLLLSLREQHARALPDVSGLITRNSVNLLAKALGISVKAAE
jgi:hypothetical protein